MVEHIHALLMRALDFVLIVIELEILISNLIYFMIINNTKKLKMIEGKTP